MDPKIFGVIKTFWVQNKSWKKQYKFNIFLNSSLIGLEIWKTLYG